MDKKYIITDGIKYIKLNDKNDPTKTNSMGSMSKRIKSQFYKMNKK